MTRFRVNPKCSDVGKYGVFSLIRYFFQCNREGGYPNSLAGDLRPFSKSRRQRIQKELDVIKSIKQELAHTLLGEGSDDATQLTWIALTQRENELKGTLSDLQDVYYFQTCLKSPIRKVGESSVDIKMKLSEGECFLLEIKSAH